MRGTYFTRCQAWTVKLKRGGCEGDAHSAIIICPKCKRYCSVDPDCLICDHCLFDFKTFLMERS